MGAEEHPLEGGRITAGVVRVGDTVRRPLGPHSPFVHRLLRHLQAAGFDRCACLLGCDEEGREVLSYLPGEVPADLAWFSDAVLREAFALLRAFHDATAGSALPGGQEVVLHGDVSPCNTVFRDGRPVALIDLDAARPGPRLHDVGYGLALWLDLGDGAIALDEQCRRLRLACAAYGVERSVRVGAAIAAAVGDNVARLRAAGRPDAYAWWSELHAWTRTFERQLDAAWLAAAAPTR